MSQWMSATFLGTSSGGGPTESRNCSSLVLDIVGDVIDGAEGTLRQFSLQPEGGGRSLQVAKVNKIFITHMHPDHIMGLPTLLRNILGFPHPEALSSRGTPTLRADEPYYDAQPRVNLYGPAGLRAFLRTTLSLTRTKAADRYAHHNEEPGQDVLCDSGGFWRDFAEGRSMRGSVNVCAGPLVHRDPCIGYIIHEPATLATPRKLAILGDTSDASQLTTLVRSTPGRLSLLVHEATDAHMPGDYRRASCRSAPARARSVQNAGTRTLDPNAGRRMCGSVGRQTARPKPHRHPIPSTVDRLALGKESRGDARELSDRLPRRGLLRPARSLTQGQGKALGWKVVRRAIAAHDFMVVQVPLQAQIDDQGASAGANGQPGRGHPEKRRRKAYTPRGGGNGR
ncbi:beta-lactamase-like protein [Lactarius indigo]|nr:beta-lactamase-like protein [Lactarius indigo]